ncbi:hypothetical protein DYU11_20025 [Fibrisoma montanum]|uniref:Uncharacterized protein n=1 Tax=Fibrisoma montanum TaxID=2305895 RepID=A0A418M3M9_9BACT|nr:hypothetical protein [Fibrisoma montanum]RIV20341.1 hypothetical protein DYU11_20025 [Fibrisoma montanum]
MKFGNDIDLNSNELKSANGLTDASGAPAATSGIPTVAPGAAAGTGATATLEAGSNDRRGAVTINYGSSGSLNSGAIFALTFSTPFSAKPVVLINGANNLTQGNNTRFYMDETTVSTSQFAVAARSTTFGNSSVVRFTYIVQP